MIKSFKDKETELVFNRTRSRRLPPGIQQVALRKLRMLNNAVTLNDLRIPPANAWKSCRVIRLVNTVFALMINGGYALNGKMVMLTG